MKYKPCGLLFQPENCNLAFPLCLIFSTRSHLDLLMMDTRNQTVSLPTKTVPDPLHCVSQSPPCSPNFTFPWVLPTGQMVSTQGLLQVWCSGPEMLSLAESAYLVLFILQNTSELNIHLKSFLYWL